MNNNALSKTKSTITNPSPTNRCNIRKSKHVKHKSKLTATNIETYANRQTKPNLPI